MRSEIIVLLISIIFFISCNNTESPGVDGTLRSDNETMDEKDGKYNSKGYVLMSQKCFLCHFQKPDPAKKDQMIAPPMLRVQEHYKPIYPDKKDFVKSVVEYIHNPSVEKTLMPGAVKKFRLMPKLIYNENELELIVETLFDIDLGQAPNMKRHNMKGSILKLNKGEKWKLKPVTFQQIDAVTKRIDNFNSQNIDAYNQLGKDVFDDAKFILLDESYTGETFNQIHTFFSGIEGLMRGLMTVKTKDEADKLLSELKSRLSDFHNYFE